MGRRMLKMEKIPNEKTRMTTYKKRKKCLFKKAWEFSTLCGVQTCVIVYGPDRSSGPEIWPEDPIKVRDTIVRYANTAPSSSSLKSYRLTDFFAAKKKNIDGRIERSRKETWKAKCRMWEEKLTKCSPDQLRLLMVQLEDKIHTVSNRIFTLEMQKKAGSSMTAMVEASRPVEQPGVCNNGIGYRDLVPLAIEQPQLPPRDNPRLPDVPFFRPQDQLLPMNPNHADAVETMMMLQRGTNGFNQFHHGGSEIQYNHLMNRPVYYDPYGMGSNLMFNRANLFAGYYPVDPMAAQMAARLNEYQMASRVNGSEDRKNFT